MKEKLMSLIRNSNDILKFEDGTIYQCISNKNLLMAKLLPDGSSYPINAYVVSFPEELKELDFEVITGKDVVDLFGYSTPPRKSLVKLDSSVDWLEVDRKLSEFSKTLVGMHKTH